MSININDTKKVLNFKIKGGKYKGFTYLDIYERDYSYFQAVIMQYLKKNLQHTYTFKALKSLYDVDAAAIKPSKRYFSLIPNDQL